MKVPIDVSVKTVPRCDSVSLELLELYMVDTRGRSAPTGVDDPIWSAGQRLKPSILFSTRLRNQGAGMPDGGLFPQRYQRIYFE